MFIWGQDTPQFRPLQFAVPITQVSCGAQHVAFLTALKQVYTYGGMALFVISLRFLWIIMTELVSYFYYEGNDVYQCGLGCDSSSFVSEPTIIPSLIHVREAHQVEIIVNY
jgi:alpha-tubulin suppressor-like RCC1 family protein